jgi:hypothetical protein
VDYNEVAGTAGERDDTVGRSFLPRRRGEVPDADWRDRSLARCPTRLLSTRAINDGDDASSAALRTGNLIGSLTVVTTDS